MEHKTIKNKLSKTGTAILYSTVFFGIGCIFADVTGNRNYLANGLILLGTGWIILGIISKFETLKKHKETGSMFCFKCNTIHDYPNSICKFESKV